MLASLEAYSTAPSGLQFTPSEARVICYLEPGIEGDRSNAHLASGRDERPKRVELAIDVAELKGDPVERVLRSPPQAAPLLNSRNSTPFHSCTLAFGVAVAE